MPRRRVPLRVPLLAAGLPLALAGCAVLPTQAPAPVAGVPPALTPAPVAREAPASAKAGDVVLFALALMETGYRFGGKNPEAGLDCSGMVSYVFDKAAGLRLTGSAADIARLGRPIEAAELKPGDLVFFNTQNRPFSHVGIYIGDGRFIHAPSSAGRVRAESLASGYFAARFEAARSVLD